MKPKIKRVIDGKEHNIELTSEEVRSVYSSQSDDYLCEDASNQLKDYVEERYGTGEAALETFKEVHGYSLIELLENEEFMKKLASDFGDVQDCNIPENDTWESVIEDALDVFKENMSRARQKGMNGYRSSEWKPRTNTLSIGTIQFQKQGRWLENSKKQETRILPSCFGMSCFSVCI